MESTRRVLVVEDHEVNMELTTVLLELDGYNVSQATCAEDGIELASREVFDLILMDLSLPGVDGLTATRRLRQIDRLVHVPIVALTAHAMRGDKEKAMAAGCNGYITKPIDFKSFIETVQTFIS